MKCRRQFCLAHVLHVRQPQTRSSDNKTTGVGNGMAKLSCQFQVLHKDVASNSAHHADFQAHVIQVDFCPLQAEIPM